MTYVVLSCRVLIGTVFAVSGVTKVRGRGSFAAYARSVARLASPPAPPPLPALPALPRKWILRLARIFVAAEFAIAGLLAIPLTVAAYSGFAVAVVLLTIFSAALVRSLSRGDRTPCRCFGATTAKLGWRHVARNAFLAGVAVAGLLSSPGSSAGVGLSGLAVSALIGLVLGALVTQLDQFAELFGPSRLAEASTRPLT